MSRPADHRLKAGIRHLLEAWGFQVNLLDDRQNKKTPDLLVTSASERYLIEVKEKLDDIDRVAVGSKSVAQGSSDTAG